MTAHEGEPHGAGLGQRLNCAPGREGTHRAPIRLVIGGALALAATWLIGTLLGTTGVV